MEWVTHARTENDAAIGCLRAEVLAAWNALGTSVQRFLNAARKIGST